MTTDAEMLEIDALEDSLAPLAAGVEEARELISSLELCHHKARNWVRNIVDAIGAGGSNKGLGTRPPGSLHDAERIWIAACEALDAWCAGCPAGAVEGTVGGAPASRLAARVGHRSPLKEWQVLRVIERIRSLINWPPPTDDPSADFTWLLLDDAASDVAYRTRCPDRYLEHEAFWQSTARTIINDTQDGREAPLSLALAIDMLWPCHRDFTNNLEVVLAAIGGNHNPEHPFAACGRNISRLADREHFASVARALDAWCAGSEPEGPVDAGILDPLGLPTPEKRWLAASLTKTIRLQLDPPEELRELMALPGPEWIHEPVSRGAREADDG